MTRSSSRVTSVRAARAPTHSRFPTRGQEAFTVIEAMMAAIVMAFAVTTSITVMQRGFASLDTARNITYAAQIMQNELEKMRLLDWAAVNSRYATTDATVAIDSAFTSNTAIANRFSLRGRRSLVHDGMNEITLTISWNSYDGRTHTRSIKTYYGQNGLYDYVYAEL